jgi:hypothetical protein
VLATWSNFNRSFKFGNSFDLGRFDECMTFKVNNIAAQHCLVLYQYKLPSRHPVISVPPNSSAFNNQWRGLSDRFGSSICLPSSCTGVDIEKVVEAVLDGGDFMLAKDYNPSMNCRMLVTEGKKFDVESIFHL